MAANSKIEWTDHNFIPWVGCTKVSGACDHCYAEAWAKRTGQPRLWTGVRRRTSAANWRLPMKWDREAAAVNVKRKVFCASLADVFDNQVDPSWRTDLWSLIRNTPNLDWQLLTKRPQNILKMLPPDWGDGYRNVWLGTTVENQVEAARRIPFLVRIPAAVRFLSVEPLLEAVDLSLRSRPGRAVDWVIVGGESGPGYRRCRLAGPAKSATDVWLSASRSFSNNGAVCDPNGPAGPSTGVCGTSSRWGGAK